MYIKNLQNNIQSTFITYKLITQSCHDVLNATLIAPIPKPPWFDNLNSLLDVVKKNASQWINDLAPAMTANIPLQVINYGTTYEALSTQINDITSANPNACGGDNKYVMEVKQLVSSLGDISDKNITALDSNSSKLETWSHSLKNAYNNLSNVEQSHSCLAELMGNLNIIFAAVNIVLSELILEQVYWNIFKIQDEKITNELHEATKTLADITTTAFSDETNKEWKSAVTFAQKLTDGPV